MQLKSLLSLAAAQVVVAQSLTDVLASQNSTLSVLNSLLRTYPPLTEALGNAKDITILAPSDAAFKKLLDDPAVAAAIQANPDLVPALLTYHVLNGTFYSTALAGLTEPAFVPTFLSSANYSTVSGGQRVEVRAQDGGVVIYSGNGAQSKVQAVDFNFTGGTIHIIDNVLTIPPNLTTTLANEKLTSLTSAVTAANLVSAVADIPQLTLFAPNNAAFEAIASVASGLTTEQLAAVLTYHVVPGAVVYSVDVENGAKAPTVLGSELTFRVEGGAVFVNDARVVKANVLTKNGVVHVIDKVLIPPTNGTTPSGTGTGGASGTATATVVPGAAPRGSVAMGLVALAGGLAVLLNM